MTGAARSVAIFDLDRTITRCGTFTPFLLFAARRRPWRFLLLPLVVVHMLRYVLGRISRKRLKEHMLAAFLQDLSRDEIEDLAVRFVERLRRRGLRPGALRRIDAHLKDGHRVIIATASMDFYVTVLAQDLGISEFVATRSCWNGDGHLLPAIEGKNCYGAAKLDMIRESVKDLAGTRSDFRVTAYSDHVSDLPFLDWADEAIVVNPSAALRARAEERNFPIEDWNKA